MGDVTHIGGKTKLDIPVNGVLEGAIEKDLDVAIVMGYDKDGKVYFASSIGDAPEMNYLADKFKRYLLDTDPADEII